MARSAMWNFGTRPRGNASIPHRPDAEIANVASPHCAFEAIAIFYSYWLTIARTSLAYFG